MKKKPELKINKISTDGKIKVNFNQPMLVPSFIIQDKSKIDRKLLALSEINVARDIFDFKFISN